MRKSTEPAYFWVNSFWVDNGTVVFNNTNTSGTGTSKVSTSVQTDITKTLYDESFTTPTRRRSDGAKPL